MMKHRLMRAVVLIALALACEGNPTASKMPGPQPHRSVDADATPHFLRPAPGAPPLEQTRVSFWAVNGSSREGRIRYRSRSGQGGSVDFARLIIPSHALVRRPNGQPIPKGDSLRITMTVVDQSRLILDLQPAGLRFNSQDPALLRMYYYYADKDFDRDGDRDARDAQLELRLKIWCRERITEPWVRLVNSVLDAGEDRVRVQLAGFTHYAIAF